MASKTGCLSDAHFEKNCLDYHALPVGYANSRFQSTAYNPMLSGIKALKYQPSASKPMSADVLAVNMSIHTKGNRAQNARGMLDAMAQESRVFRPTATHIIPIAHEMAILAEQREEHMEMVAPGSSVMTQTERYADLSTGAAERRARLEQSDYGRSFLAVWDKARSESVAASGEFGRDSEQQVSILPRTTGPSRGDRIQFQTIGVQAGSMMIDDVKNWFKRKDRAGQNEAANKLQHQLIQGNLNPEFYMPVLARDVEHLGVEDRPPMTAEGVVERSGESGEGYYHHVASKDSKRSFNFAINRAAAPIREDMFVRMVQLATDRNLPGFNPKTMMMDTPKMGIMDRLRSGAQSLLGGGSQASSSQGTGTALSGASTQQPVAPAPSGKQPLTRSAATGQGSAAHATIARTPEVMRY